MDNNNADNADYAVADKVDFADNAVADKVADADADADAAAAVDGVADPAVQVDRSRRCSCSAVPLP